MDEIKVGKTTLRICNGNKTPELFGLSEGTAVAFWGSDLAEFEPVTDAICARYRVVEQGREDVKINVVRSADETLPAGKVALIVKSVDLLGEVLSFIGGEEREVIVLTDAIDCSANAIASAFGSLTSLLVQLTDYRVWQTAIGDKYDGAAVSRLRRTVLRGRECCSDPSAMLKLHVEALTTLFGSGISATEGGHLQMSRTIELLLRHERRSLSPRGVTELLCAHVLTKVYKIYMLTDFGFVAPPDNNFRIEQASEYLGVDERLLASKMSPLISERQLGQIKHCLKTNKGEILAELCYHEIILKRALSDLKRILPDCGFETFGELDSSDLKLALALAPDLSEKSDCTLVGIMKSVGVLDAFL